MYKILLVQQRHNTTKLVSFTGNANGYSIEYKIGEWAYPTIGKLFLFNSYKNAICWLGCSTSSYKIFKCEAKNANYCPVIAQYNYSNLSCNIQKFWNKTNPDYYNSDYIIMSPIGTMSADAIKLTEEVVLP